MEQVRFDLMTPPMVRARREACNLAYLPVGTLEWHGVHMPLGTDYLTATLVTEEAARRFGGVVFPPIYYGDPRYILLECKSEWRPIYAQEMGVPESYPAAFPLQNPDGSPGWQFPTQADDGLPASEPLPFTAEEQIRDFVRLIARTMLAIHLYGFRRILLMSGHGSNDEFCRRAEEVYRQNVLRRAAFGPPAQTRTCVYWEAFADAGAEYDSPGYHADKGETSLTMAAAPGCVHLELLPQDPEAPISAWFAHPYVIPGQGFSPEYRHLWDRFRAWHPRHSTEEFGRAQLEVVLHWLEGIAGELMQQSAPGGAGK